MVTYTHLETLTLIPRDATDGRRELITDTDIAKTREIKKVNRVAACPAKPAFLLLPVIKDKNTACDKTHIIEISRIKPADPNSLSATDLSAYVTSDDANPLVPITLEILSRPRA